VHYLSHLAGLGATNLHPHGLAGTAQLIGRLDIQPGQQVLEIGCGTGETLVRVALTGSVRATGVDVLPEMLRVARTRLRWTGLQDRAQTAEVRVGAALPFTANSFDRIFTESVLGFQDAASAEVLLAEIFRVLVPGGRYVANEAVWKPAVPDDLIASVYSSCQADFGLCHASAQNWPAQKWCNVMEAAGFAVLSAETLDGLAGQTPAGQCTENERPAPDPSAGLDPQLRLLLSRLVTLAYRGRASLSPRVELRRLSYRRRLRSHRADGSLIESRLFVLRKPEQVEDGASSAADPRPPALP
jgi:SAM-dependent methyltransferase